MSYTTVSQMLVAFGMQEIAEITTPDDLPVIDAILMRLTVSGGDRSGYSQGEVSSANGALERVNFAIDEAGAIINSYLSNRYTIPLSNRQTEASCLSGCCRDIARYLLHDDSVTEAVTQRYDAAIRWLRDVAAGKASLGSVDTSAPESGAGMPDFVVPSDPIDITGF